MSTKPHSLASKGLSMSQAASISNSCYQKTVEYQSRIDSINNASKLIVIDGKTYETQTGYPIPADINGLLLDKAKLHACQAFLMENIKAKESLLKEAKESRYWNEEESPELSRDNSPKLKVLVGENWGWAQLSKKEVAEYLEVEAQAAHIGQFIHENGKLTKLRNQLTNLSSLEWMTVETGKQTPVTVTKHHTPVQLMSVYESLAEIHREAEQRVNYYKAKVNNLVTNENARIASENALEIEKTEAENKAKRAEYKVKYDEYAAREHAAIAKFESAKQLEISRLAALKIEVSPIFQETINKFLKTGENTLEA